MLVFNDVCLRRGGRALFSAATFNIHPGQRVGVTGANGTGKSSLFALLRGQLHQDQGEVSVPSQWVIAHVAQETPAVQSSAIDYVIDGDHELREIESALVLAEQAHDGHAIARLHARLESIDGYTARVRAAKLMSGLGFLPSQETLPVSRFSGGWRMRLNLAQALMCRSDLLLLDEPTNHLDLDAVIWLEEWLRAYSGTLLLISHDREFLDHVVDQIAHLEHETITLYTGNYSAFEVARAETLARQQAAYDKQQREIAHIREFVARFGAKATKARQAQSRIKALQRMELIAAAHVDSPFAFSFRKPHKIPHPLLRLDEVAVGYGEKPILEHVGLSLVPGDRLGLLGPNGAGKSTFIKLLAGQLQPLRGKAELAQELRIGYFAQHQLEQLRADDTPLVHLQRLDPKASEQQLRDFLGGFGFHGDRATERVAPFSGGEKARLVLALLVYQKPNLLLLDEPTNHLDLEMRHALTIALQEFEGAMVIVSHDRALLNSVADRLLLVVDSCVSDFDGDMDDYARWLSKRRNASPEPAKHAGGASGRKDQRRLEAEQRQRLQPLKKQLQKIELELEKLSIEKEAIAQRLAEPSIYDADNKEQLKQLLQGQSELQTRLNQAEAAWLELSEQLDAAQNG